MNKILIINDMAMGGGVENVLQNLINYLLEKEYEISVYTELYEQNFYSYYPKQIKYYHSLFSNNKRGIFKKIIRKLYKTIIVKILLKKKFEIVIAIKEGNSMKLASIFHATQKFAWVHVDYNYCYWTKDVFDTANAEIRCMKKFNKVICVSDATKKSVIDTIGDPGNLCVRYNPINIENIITKSQEISVKNKNKNKQLFVAVGRITPQKNFEMLLDAVYAVGMFEKYELWIVGDGPDKSKLENLINKYNLRNIILLGNQTNPYPLISQADWVISSAVWESFGLVIQEAAILNVPIIATRCPALDEVFDTNGGILIDNEIECLADAIRTVLRNPELKIPYVEYLEQSNKEKFWEHRLQEIENLWKGDNNGKET